MPYAHRETIYDADTHMMETPDWIASFADPSIRPRLEKFGDGLDEFLQRTADAIAHHAVRQQDASAREALEAGFMEMKNKGVGALGAFDPAERLLANDLLGFKAQIVFPTVAYNQVVAARDEEVLLGGIRALNRGLQAYCEADPRMIAISYVPLRCGAAIALQMLDEVIAAGSRIVAIDTIPPKNGQGFTHPDYDPFWARIQEADLPIALHVGLDGGWDPVPRGFFENGRSYKPAMGDAPRDALSYMSIAYNAELFLSAMIFDGVLERFPRLRIGAIEMGASWVISWMRHLDQAHRAFRRVQDLSEVKMAPSDYVRRHLKLTPFAGEDIGWLLRAGAEDLLMFSSDYPHHEGTDDPIGRFERTMDDVSEGVREKFYADNFRGYLGSQLPA
jgi:predicted TIM-barrel fold metal-dependent hydrolase